MTRPQLLDLFCGAGGAAMGYNLAGFDVTGVDMAPQPHYPFRLVEDNALSVLKRVIAFPERCGFDAIHASPPCQGYSEMSECRPGLAATYDQLIDDTRSLLKAVELPWVMENVVGSGLPHQSDFFGAHGIQLCGAMFGRETYRHRLFEASFPITAPSHPRHLTPASKAGHWKPGTFISVAGNCFPIALAREVMDIDWTTRDELAEAIPPYFTQFIGEQLIAALERAA